MRPVDKTGWGAMAVCPAIGSYPHMPTEDRMPSISEGRDHRPPPAKKGNLHIISITKISLGFQPVLRGGWAGMITDDSTLSTG